MNIANLLGIRFGLSTMCNVYLGVLVWALCKSTLNCSLLSVLWKKIICTSNASRAGTILQMQEGPSKLFFVGLDLKFQKNVLDLILYYWNNNGAKTTN